MFKSLSSAIKEAIFGKYLLVYLETIRQVVKLRSRARSNRMLEYLRALSLPEPCVPVFDVPASPSHTSLRPILDVLKSPVSRPQVPSPYTRVPMFPSPCPRPTFIHSLFSVHFGQGLFVKYVAFFWFLHSFTGHACRINRRLLLLLLYFNAAVFIVKSKRSYSPQRMLPFSTMFTFCWINNRLCKHLGTAPSLVKIISFKYFRESSLLKQVKRAYFRFPSPCRIA